MKKVIVAEKSGFCIGIDRAFKAAVDVGESSEKDVFTFGPLTHNEEAIKYLESKGVFQIDEESLSSMDKDAKIIIRAHGVPEETEIDLKNRTENLLNYTCFFVKKIHNIVREYHEKGYQIVIVGDPNHVEVIGINGWCGNEAYITRSGDDIPEFSKDICIVAQTTEKRAIWDDVIAGIKCNNPSREIVIKDTICRATTDRQDAAYKLASDVDAMVVIGSKMSSNTKKLYEICSGVNDNTQLAGNSSELDIDKLREAKVVGVTAGASTPNWVIEDTVMFIEKL